MVSTLLSLLRVRQWYKNVLIFLPILFAVQLFDVDAFRMTIIGFFALCFISSTNYIINDIVDIERDKLHPEKKKRPLAAGKVNVFPAVLIAIVLFVLGMSIGYYLSTAFMIILVFLFLLTQLYSFVFKNEAFLDILIIPINFVLRIISGAFVLVVDGKYYIELTPWIFVVPFFLFLFFIIGKREADLKFLGSKAVKHKSVYSVYNIEILRMLTIISVTLFILSYALYSFLSVHSQLILTLPIVVYGLFRYLYLIESGSEIARDPSNLWKDWRMTICFLVYMFVFFVVTYV